MDINSELKDAQLEIRDTDQSYNVNKKGMIWFNRATNKVKAIYNSAVQILATEEYVTGVDTALRADIVENGLDSYSGSEQGSIPSTPASGKRKIYTKDDGVYELGDDGIEYKLARSTEVDGEIGTLPFRTAYQKITHNIAGNNAIFTPNKDCLVFVSLDAADSVVDVASQVYWTRDNTGTFLPNNRMILFGPESIKGIQSTNFVPAGRTVFAQEFSDFTLVDLHIFYIN